MSTSIGPRGAKITIGHGKVRQTVGIPGTGISYTETTPMHSSSEHAPHEHVSIADAATESGWVVAGRALWKVVYGVTIGLAVVAVGLVLGFLSIALGGGKSRRKRY